MNAMATRKMSVPSTLTSGGMPRRLTPNTHSGKVTVRPALNSGDHVVVDRQRERKQARRQDAREDQREGHAPEGRALVRVQVHPGLLERAVEADEARAAVTTT